MIRNTLSLVLSSLLFSNLAFAEGADSADSSPGAPSRPVATAIDEVPRVAYARGAFGSSAPSVGAAGFGVTRVEGRGGDRPWFGGGVRAWGSPIDRVTILAEGKRRDNGEFAPSVGAQLRLLGSRSEHYAIALGAEYLAEGFAELGGEIEGGVLASYAKARLHLDANLVVGGGFDEGEADGELLARLGYDVMQPVRLGLEGRVRQRLAGRGELPGARTADGFVGAQAMLTHEQLFLAVTGGPTTIAIANGVGWSALATFGGAAF